MARNEIHNADGFRRVLFIFNTEELKYRISNVAFSQGDVARVHDNYGHDILGDKGENYMHQWKDVCEEGNWDRVKQVIEIAISDVEQLLYKFTATVIENDISMDNTDRNAKEYAIELKTSKTFSQTTADLLMRNVEEYIIDTVLEDWAYITYPEAVVTWNAKKNDTERKISTARGFNMAPKQVKPTLI